MKKSVAATDLARLLTCENQVLLRKRYGDLTTRELDAFCKQGNHRHRKFHHEVTRYKRGRCFIASAVFGEDAPETGLLRQFRDEVLRPHRSGRWLILWYYHHSPALAAWLSRHPRIQGPIRTVLRTFLRWWKGTPK